MEQNIDVIECCKFTKINIAPKERAVTKLFNFLEKVSYTKEYFTFCLIAQIYAFKSLSFCFLFVDFPPNLPLIPYFSPISLNSFFDRFNVPRL